MFCEYSDKKHHQYDLGVTYSLGGLQKNGPFVIRVYDDA